MNITHDRQTLRDEITSRMDNLIQMSRDIHSTREFVLLNWDEETINEVEPELEHLTGLSDMLLGVVKEFHKNYSMEIEIEEALSDSPTTEERLASDHTNDLVSEINAQMPMGWTPVDLAKASGVRQKTIDLLLSGTTRNPHSKTLRKIEKALGLEEGHLDE